MSFMHHCLGICICNTTAQQAGIKAVGWCAVAKAVAACKEHKWCRVPLVINLYDRHQQLPLLGASAARLQR
jgi:hypothetical protein